MRRGGKRETIRQFALTRGIIRASDVEPLGVSASYLSNLAREGTLTRMGRGMYALPDYSVTENHSLAEVAAYAPRGIICLVSALQFHGIGTQLPHKVWIALPQGAWLPKVPTVQVQVVRMSPASLTAGVESHSIEGVSIRIFSAAKTIADCFKFRGTVGLDVALEALRDALSHRQVSRDDLYEFAVTDRVWQIMRPYLEAMS